MLRPRALAKLCALCALPIAVAVPTSFAAPPRASASTQGANTSADSRGALVVPGVGQVSVAWWRVGDHVYAPLSACIAWFNLMHVPQRLTSDGWVVGDLPSSPQAPPSSGPLYLWYWQPAHGDEVTYGGPIDANAVTQGGQRYVDVDALQQLLAALHVETRWQGSQLAVIDPVPQTSLPASGVAPVAYQGPGDLWPEPWFYGEADITSSALYNPLAPVLPLRLKAQDGFSGEVMITVRSQAQPNELHHYSARMVNGVLDATIRLPFAGALDVQVDEVLDESSLKLRTLAYSRAIESAAPSLPLQSLGLLQSWFVNDNESPSVAALAASIAHTSPGARSLSPTQVDAEIRAISDWASQNIRYNWPAYLNGQIPWQQMTTTLSLRYGVCQDISGVATGLLRALGIPALVVQGQGLGELGWGPHQWDEAWDGRRWVIFDPTFDAVYTSDAGIAPPSSVTHDDFDPPQRVFAQNHRGGQIADW
ncbi:transglutaminase-like domain-containing protein [Alicyclobacillus sendaiensis]|uniref:Transglutaminase-like domain-containing protein n=1 Tax=Alicyclobacillus sendaiensis PA2 TaxID=3029425 RepID=A0ABT6Y0E4_ALISE|nr:transglutaminase-like domain-containing protein [Alicyclobacillus sendaiensis]MDI9260819.1 transglutaminase-like domain-containing protein [Alicyclobacillus sendaiensis PA2]